MRNSLLVLAVFAVALTVTLVSPAFAQSSSPFKIEGTVSDYTDALNAAGPWNITANWPAELRGRSGGIAHGYAGDITGGGAVELSNIGLTFGGAAIGHFGDQPIEGVVTLRR